jgi:hypothetical protein
MRRRLAAFASENCDKIDGYKTISFWLATHNYSASITPLVDMNSIRIRSTTLRALGHPYSLGSIAVLHSLALTHCGMRDAFDVLSYFAFVGISWVAVFLGRGTFNPFPGDDNAELSRIFEKGCLFMGCSCLLNLFFISR